jgi:hydroxymethylglutaryl-CoA lyase
MNARYEEGETFVKERIGVARDLPKVEIIEEGMREGLQIEDAFISVEQKLKLLDALSRTGLSTIVVGSFVSPKWTPQMADIDELVDRFTPLRGVNYTALALNEIGRERLRRHVPPLVSPDDEFQTLVHACDVFVRRNTNRSQAEEIAGWDGVIERAVAEGARHAGIAVNAAWGSNWLGSFDESTRTQLLERQYALWSAANVKVDRVWLGDPMGWNLPHDVASQLRLIRKRWPSITKFHLHLHDARGTALLSAYQALLTLGPECTLVLDTSIGGMGGCPYGGHGQMTRMIATEDLVDLLHESGVDTGVDLDRLIEAAAIAEEVVGHTLWGHVSKAGARPRGSRLFPMDLPFIQTERQAQHFRLGPSVYDGALSPWAGPIESPHRVPVREDQIEFRA